MTNNIQVPLKIGFMFLGMSNFADFELEAEFDWHELEAEFDWHKPGVRKRNVTDFRWQITWSVNHQFQISTIDLVADIDIFNSDNLVADIDILTQIIWSQAGGGTGWETGYRDVAFPGYDMIIADADDNDADTVWS